MRPRTFLSLIAVALLGSCSSSGTKPSSTTIDPLIATLQQEVEELKNQVNATTIPTTTTTTTTKAPPYIVEIRVFASGNVAFDQHECREIVEYSDGSWTENRARWWVKSNDSYPHYPC